MRTDAVDVNMEIEQQHIERLEATNTEVCNDAKKSAEGVPRGRASCDTLEDTCNYSKKDVEVAETASQGELDKPTSRQRPPEYKLYPVVLNPEQKFPLTEYCLEHYECECHQELPDYSARETSPAASGPDEPDETREGSHQDTQSFKDDIRSVMSVDGASAAAGRQTTMKHKARFIFVDARTLATGASSRGCNAIAQGQATREAISNQGRSSHASGSQPESPAEHGSEHGSSAPEGLQPDPAPEERERRFYSCNWKACFGGACTAVFNNAQSHDRHVTTHLPDDDGYELTNYECAICDDRFNREESCRRHVRVVHHREGRVLELIRPWWWPVELFESTPYKTKICEPQPLGVNGTWEQRIRSIIAKHRAVINKPSQRERGRKRRHPAKISPRPAKLRKTA